MNKINFKNLKNQPFITLSFLSIQTAVFLLAYVFPSLLIEFRGSMFGPSRVLALCYADVYSFWFNAFCG